jgi:hypothetical protein
MSAKRCRAWRVFFRRPGGKANVAVKSFGANAFTSTKEAATKGLRAVSASYPGLVWNGAKVVQMGLLGKPGMI